MRAHEAPPGALLIYGRLRSSMMSALGGRSAGSSVTPCPFGSGSLGAVGMSFEFTHSMVGAGGAGGCGLTRVVPAASYCRLETGRGWRRQCIVAARNRVPRDQRSPG